MFSTVNWKSGYSSGQVENVISCRNWRPSQNISQSNQTCVLPHQFYHTGGRGVVAPDRLSRLRVVP